MMAVEIFTGVFVNKIWPIGLRSSLEIGAVRCVRYNAG